MEFEFCCASRKRPREEPGYSPMETPEAKCSASSCVIVARRALLTMCKALCVLLLLLLVLGVPAFLSQLLPLDEIRAQMQSPVFTVCLFVVTFVLDVSLVGDALALPLEMLFPLALGLLPGSVLIWAHRVGVSMVAFNLGRHFLAGSIRARLDNARLVAAIDLAFAEKGTLLVVLLLLCPVPEIVTIYVLALTRV